MEIRKLKYIATATTGIAALLIKNAKTLHSALKVPLDIDGLGSLNIDRDSKKA